MDIASMERLLLTTDDTLSLRCSLVKAYMSSHDSMGALRHARAASQRFPDKMQAWIALREAMQVETYEAGGLGDTDRGRSERLPVCGIQDFTTTSLQHASIHTKSRQEEIVQGNVAGMSNQTGLIGGKAAGMSGQTGSIGGKAAGMSGQMGIIGGKAAGRSSQSTGGGVAAGELLQVIGTQYELALRNGNADKARTYAVEAATMYETGGLDGMMTDFPKANEFWNKANEITRDETTMWGLVRTFERLRLGEVLADEWLMVLCEDYKDVKAVMRILSRPAYRVLEARRGGMDEHAGWVDLEMRVNQLVRVSPAFDFTLFASRAALVDRKGELNIPVDYETALRVLNAAAVSDDNAVELAFKTRALFSLARHCYLIGDFKAATYALDLGEQIEQQVFACQAASLELSTTRKTIIIGTSSFVPRPFTGTELLSLVASRTSVVHLTRAQILLAQGLEGLGPKHLFYAVQRSVKSGLPIAPNSIVHQELLRIKQWAESLVNVSCSTRGDEPLAIAKAEIDLTALDLALSTAVSSISDSHARVTALEKLHITADSSSQDVCTRRVARLFWIIGQCIALEKEQYQDTLNPPTEVKESIFEPMRRLLPSSLVLDQASVTLDQAPATLDQTFFPATTSRPLLSVLADVWQERRRFVQASLATLPATAPSLFDVNPLLKLIEENDAIPLAYEIMGKFYMGILTAFHGQFTYVPPQQPDRKFVKDPARAVRCFQKAIELDPIGLGAIAPLANAYHTANQEDKVATLYRGTLDFLGKTTTTSTEPLVLITSPTTASWTLTRLGMQQLHYGKYVNAATSFQRALGAFGRSENSQNIEAWTGMGESHFKMGRLGASAQSFEKAIQVLTKSKREYSSNLLVVCFLKLAKVRLQSGQSKQAVGVLKRALLLNKSVDVDLLDVVRLDLGQALVEHGRCSLIRGGRTQANICFTEAAVLFIHATEKTPSDASAWKGLGDACVLQIDDIKVKKDAGTAYLKACHLQPWESLARYDLAFCLLEDVGGSTTTSGVICAEAAVVLDPHDALAWNLLGLARQKQVMIRQHCVVRSLLLDAESWSLAWLNLGYNFLRGNRPALAKRAFSQAQTVDADSSLAWLGHWKVLRCSGGGRDSGGSSGGSSGDTIAATLASLECAVDAAGFGNDSGAYRANMLLSQALFKRVKSREPCENDTVASDRIKFLRCASLAVQLARTESPDLAAAWNMVGLALRSLGKKQTREACSAFETSATLYLQLNLPAQADRVLVNLALTMEDSNVALQIVEMSLMRTPELQLTPQVWGAIGTHRLKLGDQINAEQALGKAVQYSSGTDEHDAYRVAWLKTMMISSDISAEMFSTEIVQAIATDALTKIEFHRQDEYHLLRALAETSEAARRIVSDVVFPELPIYYRDQAKSDRDEERELNTVAITMKATIPFASCRLFPWLPHAWNGTSSVVASTDANVLALCEAHPPADVSIAFAAAKRLLASNCEDRPVRGYWSSKIDVKMRFLCPWEAI